MQEKRGDCSPSLPPPPPPPKSAHGLQYMHVALTHCQVENLLPYCSALYLIKSRGYVAVDETIPASAPAVSRSIGRCSLGSSGIFSC